MKNSHVDVDKLVGVGLYSISDTARVLSQALGTGIDRTRLTRWAHGRKKVDSGHSKLDRYAPVVGSHLKVADSYLFTFSDLIELFTVATLRQKKILMRTIRYAYLRATEQYGEHPFAKYSYSIFGSGIFKTPTGDENGLEELSTGSLAFEKLVKPLLQNVSYSDETASMFSPLGTDRSVVLDPARAFGAPIDKHTGIATAILYGMVMSGESEDSVANWYGVSLEGVHDAVIYELALKEAA